MRLGVAAALLLAAPAAAAQPAPGSLAAPVPNACISSPFGLRRAVGPRGALFHNGIDFPAAPGTWVRPAAPGMVVAIRRLGSSGLEVDVAHPAPPSGGAAYMTRYAHLGAVSPALAGGGRAVTLATGLGRVGRTGITYGTHVHVEMHVGGTPANPEPFFAAGRCR